LPEVGGDTGLYTDLEPAAIAATIQTPLTDSHANEAGRQRLLTEYPVHCRAEQMYSLIDSLLG
jgi:hypothetical protein